MTSFSGVAGFPGEHHSRHFEQDYYGLPYTLKSGDERVLSRWNMVEQKLTVSRKQCIVKVNADGTATLTSCGKSPTFWRQRDGPWCAVPNGESLILTDGDQVSLDCNVRLPMAVELK